MQASAPAADLTRLGVGATAQVSLDALPGVGVVGRVVALSPSVDPQTALGQVRIALEAQPRARIGLAGRARILVGTREAVPVVPASAIVRGAQAVAQAVVCQKDGEKFVAELREVKLGARVGADVEIEAGATAGELIVTAHMLGLESGKALILAKSPADSPGKPPSQSP